MNPDFRLLANDFIRNLTPYQPGKPIEELEREYGITSSIKLASNENAWGASPHVIATAQSMLKNMHIYPDGGCYELKQALSKFLSVPSSYLTIGNGSEDVLALVMKAFLQKDDNAVLSQYAFLTIPLTLQSFGINIKTVPAKQWGHDINAMLHAVDAKTRVLFIVNPNNPTGTYTNEKDFLHLMQNVPKHVLVVLDEAYFEFGIGQPDYPRSLHYLQQFPNLLICRTFSKAYGMSGLRLGYGISSEAIADILNRARMPFNINSIAAKCGCSALEDQNHVQKTLKLTQAGLKQIEQGLNKLGLSYIPSCGNFISIDVGDGKAVYEQLLLEGVIVRPLHAYNMKSHIRVTIGTAEENERFLAALERVYVAERKAALELESCT